MKFRYFFRALITGTVAIFLIFIFSLGWITTQSSLNLLNGGVNTFPQGAIFMPKRSPGLVSLLTNPEKLYAWRGVSLPLKSRRGDRRAWQQWETSFLSKIGFDYLDYQKNFQPWLGDEITFGITSLDYDRNPSNGNQPGYLLAVTTKSNQLAQEYLPSFYREIDNVNLEPYKGVNIMAIAQSSNRVLVNSNPWSSVIVGNFVLFSNQPQILKKAINQAQVPDLNLSSAENYQLALRQIKKPHIGVAYFDVLGTSAWLDNTSAPVNLTPNPNSNLNPNSDTVLSAFFAISQSGLSAETALIETSKPNQTGVKSQTGKSWLNNPELQKILNSLPFDNRGSAYINLQEKTSLLEEQIPLYKVTKLAVKSLFPHLKAIAIRNLGNKDNKQDKKQNNINRLNRLKILWELDG